MSSVPIVGSAADLTGAIARAERSPSARAHVARRAAELGLSERIPEGWGMTAAGPHKGGALGKIGHAVSAAWDEMVHPRDMNGQWIENGGHVDISAGHGSRRTGSGKVVGNTPDGRVLVAIEHGDGAGTTKTLSAGSLTKSADTRARLGESPAASKPDAPRTPSAKPAAIPATERLTEGNLSDGTRPQAQIPDGLPPGRVNDPSPLVAEQAKIDAKRASMAGGGSADDWIELGDRQTAVNEARSWLDSPGDKSRPEILAEIAQLYGPGVGQLAADMIGAEQAARGGDGWTPIASNPKDYSAGADALDAAQARLPIDPAHPVARDLGSATAEATGALRDPATNLRLAGRSGKATDEHRAALEAIIANPDHAAAHKGLAALMTSMTFGGKQRKRYRELLDAHHGKAADPASAGIEARATADALAPDNPLKDRLAAKAAAPADIADAYRSGNITWEESQALRDPGPSAAASAADNLGPAGPHMVAAQESTRADYPLGSKVRVMLQGVDQGYDGEVVGYGRNGDAIVKEPNYGTTSHVMASELKAADLGFGTRPRGDLRASTGVGLSDNGEGTPVRVTVWNPKGTQTVEVAPDAWKKIQPSFNEGSTPFGLTPEGNIMASPSSGGVSGERRVFDPKTGNLIEAFQIQMDGSKKPIAATEGDTRNSAGMSPEAAARAATPTITPTPASPGQVGLATQVSDLVESDLAKAISGGTSRFSSPYFAKGQADTELDATVGKLKILNQQNPAAFDAYAASIGVKPTVPAVEARLRQRVADGVNAAFGISEGAGSPLVAPKRAGAPGASVASDLPDPGRNLRSVDEVSGMDVFQAKTAGELDARKGYAQAVNTRSNDATAAYQTAYNGTRRAIDPSATSAPAPAPSMRPTADELNNRGGDFNSIQMPTGPYSLPWKETAISGSPTALGEAQYAAEIAPGEPGFTVRGNKIIVTDPNQAMYELDGLYEIARDNAGDSMAGGSERRAAKAKADGLKKLIDSIQTEKVRQADGVGAKSPATKRPERARADAVAASEKAAADAKAKADHAAALKAFNAQQVAPAAPVALPLEPYGPLSLRARLDIASSFTRDPAVKNAISVYLEENHKAESGSLGFIHARRQSAMRTFQKAGIAEGEIGKRVDNYRNESGPDAGRKPVRSAPVGSRDTSPAVDLPPLDLGKPETAQAQADRLAQRYGPGSAEALAAQTRATNESNRLAQSTGINRVQAAEKMYGVDSPQAVAARRRFPDGGPTLPVAASRPGAPAVPYTSFPGRPAAPSGAKSPGAPEAAPTRQSIQNLASSIRDAGGQGYDSPAGILELVQSYASNVREELADPSLKFVTIGVPSGSEVRIPRDIAQKAVDAYSTGQMSDAQALRILGVTDAAPGVTASGAPADLRKRILRKRAGGR